MSTPTPKEIQSQAKKSSAKFPGKVDESVHKCVLEEPELTPIYPVRYAYANFFGKTLEAPVDPPALSDLLKIKDIPKGTGIPKGKGYMIRLLRQGWIWLNEEGGPFHIFKYETASNGVETFVKYLLGKDENKKSELVQDKSSGTGLGYPFVFVRKGVTKIRIAFTEHELNHDLIRKLMGDSATRKKCMQLVDLGPEKTIHSVKATEENLDALVEDYRERQNKFLGPEAKDADKIEGSYTTENLDLSTLTTEGSHDLDSEKLIRVLRNKNFHDESKRNEYLENARIVALFDPIGRQKDILSARNTLLTWRKQYEGLNIYPLSIGKFIDNFRQKGTDAVKKYTEKSIINEYDQYSGEIHDELKRFDDRIATIESLYTTFCFDVDTLGSFSNYLCNFFTEHPKTKKECHEEILKLCSLGSAVFEGVNASIPSEKNNETRISVIVDPSGIEGTKGGFGAFCNVLTKVVTHPQAEITADEDKLRKAMNDLLRAIGPALGKALVFGKRGLGSANSAICKLAKALNGPIHTLMGLEINSKQPVEIMDREFNELISEIADKSPRNTAGNTKIYNMFKSAEGRIRQGKLLFDWAGKRVDVKWKLPKITISKNVNINFKKVRGQVLFCLDATFSGYSAFLNVATLAEIMGQSEYDSSNPLQQGKKVYTMFQATAAVTSLTADVLSLANAGATIVQKSAGKAVAAASLKSLSPLNQTALKTITRIAGSKAMTGLIAGANFAMVVCSTMDAFDAYEAGNEDEGDGHALAAMGSGLLLAQAIYAVGIAGGGTAGGVGATGIGLPVAFIIGAVSLTLIGIGNYWIAKYKKNEFQVLLENCFWGKRKKSKFWYAFNEKDGHDINERLKLARRISVNPEISEFYAIELQEFMNYLYMPTLEIDRDQSMLTGAKIYTYKFILPNFHIGESDINIDMFSSGYMGLPMPDRELTELFSAKVTEILENIVINEKGELIRTYTYPVYPAEYTDEDGKSGFIFSVDDVAPKKNVAPKKVDEYKGNFTIDEDGNAILEIKVKSYQDLWVSWYYMPQKEVYVPLRCLDKKKNKVDKDAVMGMLNEEPV